MSVPAAPTVAVVEDDEGLRRTIALALQHDGYAVETYGDGASAWEAFQRRLPDLAVLDILMPRMDGLALCRRLRQRSERLPIIFLTSRDDEIDRVVGLELGGDDYLCKPFSMRELAARIKVLLRRAALARSRGDTGQMELLQAGSLLLDLQRYTATWQGQPLMLTVTEFLILRALASRPGVVKTRAQLLQEGYPRDPYGSERTIDTHIKRIRRKLLEVDPSFAAIDTVHGLGYRWSEM